MPYKMVGKKRVWFDEPEEVQASQKTIQPVVQAMPAMQPVQASGLDYNAFAEQYKPLAYTDRGQKALNAVGQFAGFSGSPLSQDYLSALSSGYNQPPQHDGGPGFDAGSLTPGYDPAFLKALEGYTFTPSEGRHLGYNVTSPDGRTTQINYGDTGTSFDKFAEQAIPVGLGLLAGATFGGFIPGAEIGAAGATGGGAAAAGEVASTIGASEGAAQLAAYTAANPVTAAQIAATVPAAGLPGLGAGGLLASVPAEALASLEAFSAANPLTAAQVTASTLPAGGLPGLSSGLLGGLPTITADPLPALEAYTAANPVTAEALAATMPQIAPVASAAPAAFNAAKDSQLASSQLGITGAESAAAATAPATVSLGSLGGTMGTAGGLQGLASEASQGVRDAMTAPNAITGGGGLLGQASSMVNTGLQWLKDNPALGRLLLGGASSLLAGSGSSSGGSSTVNTGPAKQWNSPLQQGLLSPVQQYAPAAIEQNRPAGLLAQGYQNDGAWRYLKG